MKGQTKIFLHIGSNQGQRIKHLLRACAQIEQRIGPISRKSSYYETEAWGNTDQPDFINQALSVQSKLNAEDTLQTMMAIETELGRTRKEHWGPRIIDIDLLFFGSQIIDLPHLTVPHPRLHLRNFVLIPMMEIAAEFVHPIFKLSIEELYLQSEDKMEVFLLEKDQERPENT